MIVLNQEGFKTCPRSEKCGYLSLSKNRNAIAKIIANIFAISAAINYNEENVEVRSELNIIIEFSIITELDL